MQFVYAVNLPGNPGFQQLLTIQACQVLQEIILL